MPAFRLPPDVLAPARKVAGLGSILNFVAPNDPVSQIMMTPPVIGAGFMAPANRVANSSKFIQGIARQANKLKNPSEVYDAAIEYLQRYPHTLGHVKKLTFPKVLKNWFGDTLDASGQFTKNASPRSWTKSTSKLNKHRATQTPKYAIQFRTGEPIVAREARTSVRHEAAHVAQTLRMKDRIPDQDVGYFLDPREIRARAVAAKEYFTGGKPIPYADRLRDEIVQGVRDSSDIAANKFLEGWKAGNLNFPTFQKSPTEVWSFREWMNHRYPGFDNQLERYIKTAPWE